MKEQIYPFVNPLALEILFFKFTFKKMYWGGGGGGKLGIYFTKLGKKSSMPTHF